MNSKGTKLIMSLTVVAVVLSVVLVVILPTSATANLVTDPCDGFCTSTGCLFPEEHEYLQPSREELHDDAEGEQAHGCQERICAFYDEEEGDHMPCEEGLTGAQYAELARAASGDDPLKLLSLVDSHKDLVTVNSLRESVQVLNSCDGSVRTNFPMSARLAAKIAQTAQ